MSLTTACGRTLALAAAVAGFAHAATVAINPVVTAIYPALNTPTVFGWNVNAITPITVIALGAYWDGTPEFSNQVGLWTYDINQTLLASTTVTAADTFID